MILMRLMRGCLFALLCGVLLAAQGTPETSKAGTAKPADSPTISALQRATAVQEQLRDDVLTSQKDLAACRAMLADRDYKLASVSITLQAQSADARWKALEQEWRGVLKPDARAIFNRQTLIFDVPARENK